MPRKPELMRQDSRRVEVKKEQEMKIGEGRLCRSSLFITLITNYDNTNA